MEIMDMIDKRLNDSGKNWRHVFKVGSSDRGVLVLIVSFPPSKSYTLSNNNYEKKALTLLDYLVHSGSEQVVAYAKQNLYVIKTLKEFQFIDEDGRDQV